MSTILDPDRRATRDDETDDAKKRASGSDAIDRLDSGGGVGLLKSSLALAGAPAVVAGAAPTALVESFGVASATGAQGFSVAAVGPMFLNAHTSSTAHRPAAIGAPTIAAPTAHPDTTAELNGGQPVTTEAQLNAAIVAADGEAAGSGGYQIVLGGNITFTTALKAINLKSGVTLDISGGNYTLNGNNSQRGLFVYSGTVTVENLMLADMVANGGNGGAGCGGGGAGLGGALFVADNGAPGIVTLTNVSFAGDAAQGGNGAGEGQTSGVVDFGGGGGGLGGNGGVNGRGVGVGPYSQGGGGGGGIGGSGGGTSAPGSAGLVPGTAAGGGTPYRDPTHGGPSGGGGGGGNDEGGAGGGIGGGSPTNPPNYVTYSIGGGGGYGGGGGGGWIGGTGGFGGGGGGRAATRGGGGGGGFGGGGGGSVYIRGPSAGGGFGAGQGAGGGGGGGLGAGGDIFVQQGASLTIVGGSLGAGTVTGGSGAGSGTGGSAYGTGVFLQGNESITLAPAAGATETISGVITDMTGSHDASGQTGTGSLIVDGAGTLTLSATNTFTGGIALSAGTLDLAASGAAGTGALMETGGVLQVTAAGAMGALILNGGQASITAAGGATGSIFINTGTLQLATAGGATGPIVINAGTLVLAAAGAAGSGAIGFAAGSTGILVLTSAFTSALSPTSTLTVQNFGAGDTIQGPGWSAILKTVGGVQSIAVSGSVPVGLALQTSGGTPTVIVTGDQPPAPTAPATVADWELGQALAIGGVSIADGDAVASHQVITVTLTDSSGLLSATQATGATVAGAGSKSLTLSGTLSAVNTELATLTYTSTVSGPATDTVALTVNDGQGGSGAQSIAVSVGPLVTTTAQLDTAIQEAIAGSSGSIFTVPLSGTVTLASPTTTVSLPSGVTLDLASGGSGAALGGAGALVMNGAGMLALSTANSFTGGVTVDNGTVDLAAAGAAGSGPLTVDGGTLEIPTVGGAGAAPITVNSGILDVTAAGSTGTGSITFAGPGQLVLAHPGSFTNVVGGLAPGDVIDLRNVTATSVTLNASNQLVITDNGTLVAKISLAAKPEFDFNPTPDGGGGTALYVGDDIAPSVTVPSSGQVAQAGQTSAIAGIGIADSDAAAYLKTLTITLSDTSGLLSATAETGATVSGQGSDSLTLSGTLAGVNEELATLTYAAPAAGGATSDTISVVANDGRGGTGSANLTVSINQPISISVPDGGSVTADLTAVVNGTLTIRGISVADADAVSADKTITVKVSDSNGLLLAGSAPGATLIGDDTTTLTMEGSVSAVDDELASIGYIDQAATAPSSDTISISASDGRGSSATATIGVDIVAANHSLISGSHGPVFLGQVGSYGNPVTVAASATVTGKYSGLYASNSWGVVNDGSISASAGPAAWLQGGGSIANQAGAGIAGGPEGIFLGSSATVTNAGSISGSNQGIVLVAGGSVTNTAMGTIVSKTGVFGQNGGTVANAGSIGGSTIGVSLQGTGSVSNTATGTISGGSDGVSMTQYGLGLPQSGSSTLENAGTISGGLDSVQMSDSTNRLIVDGGAVFDGDVVAGSQDSNTLELTAKSGAGALNGLGSKYLGFQTLTIDPGALWTIKGTMAGFSATTIAGSPFNDTLDVTDLAYATGDTATVATGNVLEILSPNKAVLEKIQLAAAVSMTGAKFAVTSDGAGGTSVAITDPLVAFWEPAASGAWGTKADWSGGVFPNSATVNATIAQVAAAPYTVAIGTGNAFRVNSVTVDQTEAQLTINGTLTAVAGATVTAGALSLGGGTLVGSASVAAVATVSGKGTVSGAVANNGLIEASGGLLTITDNVTGSGDLLIEKAASLALGANAGEAITFAAATGPGETLILDQPGESFGTIYGFAAGDKIDLNNVTATSDRYAGGVLTVFAGTSTVASLQVAGAFSKQIFALASDGKGGTNITLAPDAVPVITVPGAQTTTAKSTGAIAGVGIADTTALAAGDTLTITLSDKTGKLSATSAGGGTVTGAASTKLIIAGSLTQVNADLATLTYTAATAGSDTITLAANDGNGEFAASKTIAVTVSAGPAAASPAAGLDLFTQSVASGLGQAIAGIALEAYRPQLAQHLELAAGHHQIGH